ncbi:MAG: hypothetical protein CL878_09120, partial [Dehalococcoidia bacterium]|nr:hypothetical protein [Dehalococcoidia bacterium]
MTTAGYLFLAEAADKTQLIVIAFAARLPARQVLAGVILAALLVNLLSVTVGSLLGSAFPRTPLQVAAGVLFVAVGFWTVLRRDTTGGREVHRLGPVMTVTLTIFWAELGDKSQLAAAGFAATTSAFILVWL